MQELKNIHHFPQGVSILKNEGAYRVLAAAQALEAKGIDIVHFEIGQPDFKTPDHISQAGIQAILNGKTTYCNPSGITLLKEAIAKHISETRGVYIDPISVIVGPGAKPGMWFAVQTLIRNGDQVLVPDPGFPTYANMVRAFDGIPIPYRAIAKPIYDIMNGNEKNNNNNSNNNNTQVNNGGGITKEIEKLIDKKTRLIIINSPSNPTGEVLSIEELNNLAKLVLIENEKRNPEEKIYILSDEIYCRLAYDEYLGKTTPSIISTSNKQIIDYTIIIDGFSKSFSMTGWRLGFVICPIVIAERLHLLMTHAIGCTALFTQEAGLVAITGPQDATKEMVKEYNKRRDYVCSRLNSMPGIHVEKPPSGAFYAFPDISQLKITSKELSEICLNDGHCAILPGSDFGQYGEGYIRISYVCSVEKLKEGLDRFEKVVTKLSSPISESSSTKRLKTD